MTTSLLAPRCYSICLVTSLMITYVMASLPLKDYNINSAIRQHCCLQHGIVGITPNHMNIKLLSLSDPLIN